MAADVGPFSQYDLVVTWSQADPPVELAQQDSSPLPQVSNHGLETCESALTLQDGDRLESVGVLF
jgi:hypothetical protein